MLLVALWLAVLLGVAAISAVARSSVSRTSRLALLAAMVVAASAVAAGRPRAAPPMTGAPKVVPVAGYVGSGACAPCHPSEYASWSKTYHHTMTQRASRSTVLARLDTPVAAEGTTYTLSADADDSIWATEATKQAERSRVLMTTGSHHMQGYWVAEGKGALRMLPFVFAREEGRAVPRREAFVEPPSSPQHDVRWNSNCIACHATGGEPRADVNGALFDTHVTELGIACEACHGPGARHVDRYADPFARVAQRRRAQPDETIVNPAHLPADRAAAACGQCHSYAYPKDEEAFWRSGYVDTFRPGDAFDRSRILLSPEVLGDPRGPNVDVAVGDLFWPDGAVRVAGREYNAMVDSACFLRGEGARRISCTSCHSMHASDPDDMLRRDVSVQAVCVGCHAMPANHSHHAPGSAGDACVSCHMPKTSYALRTAIRSHHIDVPRADGVPRPPNACNLCHLDRPLAWTARALARFRGAPEASRGEADGIPESARGLLTRDAAERAIWADAMGSAEGMAASGSDWEEPLLAYAAGHDPYAVVRYAASRSRRAIEVTHGTTSASGVTLGSDDIASLAAGRDDRDMTVAE